MLEAAEGGADVRFETGIARSRRTDQYRHRQDMSSWHAVEVEPSVQEIIPCKPFGAKRNLVLAPIDHSMSAAVGSLYMVVHVFLRTGRKQMQHVIGRVGWVYFEPA